ncbi:glycerol-3-phosphate acyltransferase [Legionella antarctica]|uniref:Glycerol-3-phosphate acyltransferase n=1 Tax=Legionella antarctica TaxID=2708020 RepID=A0A6F8T1P9_9GAMM|nr:glycerol-3-phosphate 1-O-acyltransferase PlsY [Legionella antarctica]BCA94391.1 glycerol-3-phosphate acyltransferase [Legionella antarctica]
MIWFILFVTIGYLMGSFCSAVIVCRLFALPDPRMKGSKNPGATNVLRIAGKNYAALVMLADLLKGTIPVLIAKIFDADAVIVAFTALAAVVGHMYPVFFEFKGGKGVATAIGALLGFHFIIGVMVAATWLLVAKFSRYSSLASMVAITLAPFYTLLLIPHFGIFPPLIIMALLVLFKHRNNITRLLDGIEPKINLKTNVIEEVMEASPDMNGKETEEQMVQEIPLLETKTPIKEIKSVNIKAKKMSNRKEPSKKIKTTADKPVINEKPTKKVAKKPIKTAKPNRKTPLESPKE